MNSSWKWIRKAIGRRGWLIGVLALIQSVLAASGIVFALLMRQVVDQAIAGDETAFWKAIISLGALIIGQVVLRWCERFVEDDTKAAIENGLRQKTFKEILQTDYAKMKEFHTGELMNRITSDTLVVTDGAVTLIPSLLSMLVRIVGVLIVLGGIEPIIALVFLVGGCVMILLSVLPRRIQKTMHKKVQAADGEVKSFLQESLESLLVIRAFGNEEKIARVSEKKMADHRRIRRERNHVFNIFGTGLRLCIQSGYLFGFIWCGMGILEGTVTYGTLTAVIQLIGQIQAPFASIGGTLPKYASMLASAERLMTFSESAREKEELETNFSRDDIYTKLDEIRFKDVTFGYDEDRLVLKNETFAVRKGEFAALIGNSGIGKSTIMKLLLSVYEPNKGEIKIGTTDREMKLSELPAGMFAYVPQGNYLMSGPIWQVVGFAESSERVDRKRVEKACEIACADEFIRQLPQGYDTVLGERGDGLSEGQMQRIAVARAVYSGCPILLLDEATSALDATTEKKMIANLKQMSEYTVFLVTHRKEVWELCDRVLERKE
jgi:ATP-binding cassette subfamily B protein